MKFSTLTKPDLVKAYENKLPTLEWGQAKAGETRHTLDWYYGINLSRAFTQAIKKGTNQFNLEMNKTYKNKKEFVDTLGHEMVHLYQMANLGDTGNHNDIFYSFRPKLNAIGLDI